MQAMSSPDFRDPEGRFYVARHVARYGDADEAPRQLDAIVNDGSFVVRRWRHSIDSRVLRSDLGPIAFTSSKAACDAAG